MDAKLGPIVYVSPYYDPGVPSGANRRFNEICRRLLTEFGDDFYLVVARGKKPAWWNGKNLIEVDYRFTHMSKFGAMREIGRFLDSMPPSTVIIESVPIPFRSLRRHRHFQVAYDFRYFRRESKGFFYRLIFSSYLKQQWKRSEFMVTCSEFSIDELVRYVGFPRAGIIKSYFGIDERIFSEVNPGLEKKWDIVYVGHFEKRKNHAPLLRAIAKVDPSLKVLLVGVDNGLLAATQNLAQELHLTDVTFETVSDDKKLWRMYAQSRIFAYPSVYEGFGMPLIEAMALGIPVVASDIPVFREIGDNLVSYFDPYDPDDIARALRDAFENPQVPDKERVHAHLERFFWPNIYAEFIRSLRNATG